MSDSFNATCYGGDNCNGGKTLDYPAIAQGKPTKPVKPTKPTKPTS